MEPSIFTRIINGEIPCQKIYEDNNTLAFLDIHPTQPGHTLVVTKRQVAYFTELTSEEFGALMQTSHKIAQHIQNVLNCSHVVLKIEGFDVPHVHVHLIPCEKEGDSYRAGRELEEPNYTLLAEMAQKLAM